MKGKSKPRTEKTDRGGSWKVFGSFFKNVKLSWLWIIIALVVSITYYQVYAMIPDSTAQLYAGDFSTAAILGLVVNTGATVLLALVCNITELVANARSVRTARNTVWKRMMGIRTDYYSKHDPSELLSTVTSDTEVVVSRVITILIGVPSMITYLYSCLTQVAGYNKRLLMVMFVTIPMYIIYAIFMGRWQCKTGRSIQVRIGALTGFLSERIRNLGLIKAFVAEAKEEKAGLDAAKDLYRANVQYQYINAVMVGFISVADAVVTVASVLWGCALLRNGGIALEEWLAFFMFMPMIDLSIRQLAMTWNDIKELQGRASRLGTLMEAPQEDLRADRQAEIPEGDLSFRGVRFGYEEDRAVLSDVDLVIPRGKNTAIVGVSGSGKTTILKLIEQLYLPGSGSICVGDTDVSDLNLTAWRDTLSYVTQDATIFSGTIRECLTYGVKERVSDEELIRVTRLAGVYDYVMEQGGFDAEIAIWGSAMSGGQRQRMVIARELLKDNDILLLDEPTSALDAETAAGISSTIYERFAGKTVVTVSHELSFIAGADHIIVMNDGRVAGCGTHQQLMETCPVYHGLVEEQSYQEVYGA